jgi:hypothetical protein
MSNQIERNLHNVAFEMVEKTFPHQLKEEFDLHVNASYTAQEYYEILIELSNLILAIGVGVLGNMIYKNITPSDHATKEDIQSLINDYEATIENLREKLEEEEVVPINPETGEYKLEFKDCTSIEDNDVSLCIYHEKMLVDLKEKDPRIVFSVNEAIEQLNNRHDN